MKSQIVWKTYLCAKLKSNRRLLSSLCRCALRSLTLYFEVLAGSLLMPGVITAIQSFGNRMNPHPHLMGRTPSLMEAYRIQFPSRVRAKTKTEAEFSSCPGGEVRLIPGAFWLLGSFLTRHWQSPTQFDISSSRGSSSLRMTGGKNCHKKPRSTGTAKKETLIFCFGYGLDGLRELHLSGQTKAAFLSVFTTNVFKLSPSLRALAANARCISAPVRKTNLPEYCLFVGGGNGRPSF